MITESEGRIFHPGTRIGIAYAIVAFIFLGVTMTQDPSGPLAWMSKFGILAALAPIAAGSQAYARGRRDAKSIEQK